MQRITVLQPVRSTAPSVAYPDGSAQNETVPGANDGTPFEVARSNDIFGMQQAMLHQLGLVPSGLAETAVLSQFLEGVLRLTSTGTYYVDSGAADVYVLTRFGSQQARLAYYDGMEVIFKSTNVNTGASTVDVDGIGVIPITDSTGVALTGGELGLDSFVTLRYNLASVRFELEAANAAANQAQVDAGVVADKFVSPLTNGKYFQSAEIAIPASNAVTSAPHGFGAQPRRWSVHLICKVAEFGYSIGDEIPQGNGANVSGIIGVLANATDVKHTYSTVIEVKQWGAGAITSINTGNWRLVFRAWSL